jgi:hypothetical protein
MANFQLMISMLLRRLFASACAPRFLCRATRSSGFCVGEEIVSNLLNDSRTALKFCDDNVDEGD